ncbi:MAG: Stf0 family sulphotransferase [Alteromonadaceae bacterium]
MNLYEDQFSQEYDFPIVETPSKILIIASTGRCGSHMLGHALHKTEAFGYPLEYANLANLNEWKKKLKTDNLQETIAELKKRRTSTNGVFGIKIHYSHIKQFGGFEKVLECFPDAYYILLSRENVLKQAVSLSIASQTGGWISGQKRVCNDPKYDFNHIDESLRNIILDNASWRYTLAANGCNYIEMDFDNICNNLADSLESIASFVGCKIDKTKIPKEQITKKQSNQRNTEWVAQFIADIDKNKELLCDLKTSFFTKVKRKLSKLFEKISYINPGEA